MAVVDPGGEETAMKGSLCTDPGISQPPKPDPISKPLVAGMLSIACASIASSLSKTGSPSPTGALRITHVTVPPMLSFASRYLAIESVMRAEASVSGQRTGRCASTCSRVMVCKRERYFGLVAAEAGEVAGKRYSEPTEVTKATISISYARRRYFSAMAPAATRPIVSRAFHPLIYPLLGGENPSHAHT